MITNQSGSEVSRGACSSNICRVEVELMMSSCSDIIVMVSGKSVLGTGPAALSKIGELIQLRVHIMNRRIKLWHHNNSINFDGDNQQFS